MKMKILTLLMGTTLLAAACSKSNSEDQPASPEKLLEGYWMGTYSFIGAPDTDNIAMLLQPDGKMRVYDLGNETDTSAIPPSAKLDGTWVLNAETVQTTYQFEGFTVKTYATLNDDKSEMAGSWNRNDLPKGHIFLSR
jgi:hypothetical protein